MHEPVTTTDPRYSDPTAIADVIVYSVTPKTMYAFATGNMFSHTRYQF